MPSRTTHFHPYLKAVQCGRTRGKRRLTREKKKGTYLHSAVMPSSYRALTRSHSTALETSETQHTLTFPPPRPEHPNRQCCHEWVCNNPLETVSHAPAEKKGKVKTSSPYPLGNFGGEGLLGELRQVEVAEAWLRPQIRRVASSSGRGVCVVHLSHLARAGAAATHLFFSLDKCPNLLGALFFFSSFGILLRSFRSGKSVANFASELVAKDLLFLAKKSRARTVCAGRTWVGVGRSATPRHKLFHKQVNNNKKYRN